MRYLLFLSIFVISCSTSNSPTYELNVSTSPSDGGTIDVTPNQEVYDEGTSITLTANPGEGYFFSEWTGGVSDSTNPYTFQISSDVSVTAVFEKKTYPLNISTEGDGTVTEEVIQQKDYEDGTVVRLTANPASGWSFVGWSGDIARTENPTDVIVDSEMNITAKFEPSSTTVNVDVGWSILENVPEEIFNGEQSNNNSSSGYNEVTHFGVRIEYWDSDNAFSQSVEKVSGSETASITFSNIPIADSVKIHAIAVNTSHAIQLGVIESTNLDTSLTYNFDSTYFEWFAPSWGTGPDFAESGWDTARASKSVDKADIEFDVVNPYDGESRTTDFIMRLNGIGGFENYKGDYIREYRTVVDNPNPGTADTVRTSYEWHPYIDETKFSLPNTRYIVDLRSSFIVIFE